MSLASLASNHIFTTNTTRIKKQFKIINRLLSIFTATRFSTSNYYYRFTVLIDYCPFPLTASLPFPSTLIYFSSNGSAIVICYNAAIWLICVVLPGQQCCDLVALCCFAISTPSPLTHQGITHVQWDPGRPDGPIFIIFGMAHFNNHPNVINISTPYPYLLMIYGCQRKNARFNVQTDGHLTDVSTSKRTT